MRGWFVAKPVIVEAVQWTGQNPVEVKEFCLEAAQWSALGLMIMTREGALYARPGDWIISGSGGFCLCAQAYFPERYEDEATYRSEFSVQREDRDERDPGRPA